MATRFRRADETIRKFADTVSSEAYVNLDGILKTQLDSAKTVFQKAEERASKTMDHVESSWKTLTRVIYIIISVFTVVGGGFGFFGLPYSLDRC